MTNAPDRRQHRSDDQADRLYRLAELLPDELEQRMAQVPLVVLPLGTIEWHSHHLPLGLDGLKAEAICESVAVRTGGVLAPVTYWAVGGVPFPYTMRFEQGLIERLIEQLIEQMALLGFRVVLAVTGHYGLEQTLALKRAAVRAMRTSTLTIFAGGEFEVVTDLGYTGDHASRWETSLLWAVRPELVRMDRLQHVPQDRIPEGVIGPDPRTCASRQDGQQMLNCIADRLAEVAHRLLYDTKPLARAQYIEAMDAGVRVLERLLAERAVLPKSKVPPVVTDAYLRHLQALYSGDYTTARQHAEARLTDLSL